MSLQIIKNGILDTIQDCGRYGYQHLGINAGGAMDIFSAQLSNALLGKDLDSPVIELHFPAAQLLFKEQSIICITGADFSPMINQQTIPLNQPIIINKHTLLQFTKATFGTRCYLSFLDGIKLEKWLNSYNTNIKAAAGGWNGRPLHKGDILPFKNHFDYTHLLREKDFLVLPWKIRMEYGMKNLHEQSNADIRTLSGNEWDWLKEDAKMNFTKEYFQITNNADRMGYRLSGKGLGLKENKELISSAVGFGTIQLLPGGQLIVLMADSQTTGGYPRIAHVISADLPLLAQKKPGDKIGFLSVDHVLAETQLMVQQKHLLHLQIASKFKIEKLLDVSL